MSNNFLQKFFLYARKSTDEADKQVLSIEAQLTEVREYALKESLVIAREFIETKSAKQPGRKIFEEMLAGIENGEAQGILAWHPDRLARNAVDAGKIIHLLDRGFLATLKFPTFWFDKTPQGYLCFRSLLGRANITLIIFRKISSEAYARNYEKEFILVVHPLAMSTN